MKKKLLNYIKSINKNILTNNLINQYLNFFDMNGDILTYYDELDKNLLKKFSTLNDNINILDNNRIKLKFTNKTFFNFFFNEILNIEKNKQDIYTCEKAIDYYNEFCNYNNNQLQLEMTKIPNDH